MAGPNPWIILPFVVLLFTIALAPTLAAKWWSRHYPKVSFGLGAITLLYYFVFVHDNAHIAHVAHDYISFIVLVGSLFIVSGGIHISVKGEATPLANVVFLLFGAILSNVFGTTGAAMLLIRPWIQMNQYRITAYHIAFFIFIVANVGGCLTPIGDPPLFLGYLRGIPFWWVTKNCWPVWVTGVGLLLVMFYIMDKINFARCPREVRERETVSHAWKLDGLPNLLILAVILGAVLVSHPIFLRESIMVIAALVSYLTTRKATHEANDFNFHPLQEVAILFAGIFATMTPALDWLNANAGTLLGAHPSPGTFFWGTGALSSVLDNAPTYLGFLVAFLGINDNEGISPLLEQHSIHIVAISIGAVFFGAATYIGNIPNFMVKAIANRKSVRTPSFNGYIFKFTLPFLLPTLIVVWLLFFAFYSPLH
jgi:Na+/H+ antiporter NhaD/arsenite permease-like protein